LRPELENGTLNLHDYDLALNFLPGYHRYWPLAYGSIAICGIIAYRRFQRIPWTSTRMGLAIGLSTSSVLYGEYRRNRAHQTFIRSLDNIKGFIQALENVNTKAGGGKPIFGGTVNTNANDMESSGIEDGDIQSQEPDKKRPATPTARTPSVLRWEQIRAANARTTGQNSSWDALRQKHERSIISASSANERDDNVSDEQARFDAMVEADKKNSQ